MDKFKDIKDSKEYLEAREKNPYLSEVIILQPENFNYLISEVEKLRDEVCQLLSDGGKQ